MKKQLVILGIIAILVCVGLSGCTSQISGIIGEWNLLSYGDVDKPTSALPDVNTSIRFNSDRTFGGNVGCNIFGGDWRPTTDGGISFSDIVSTEMYCEETWAQELAVLGLFSKNIKLQMIWDDNDTMTITNGTSLVKLARYIQGTGTIRYIDLEGGFYGIIGDDQNLYDPINLPEAYKQDNLRVEFKARVSPNQNSIHQWGKIIYILEIKQLVS
ncbi:MAG: META domain-containing protein [Candidatus Thermoplasmatota archaeon]|nr:META domain-containing protein [Candidatus Thermoplasmatota archaeon]